MRYSALASIALALTGGCLRFGYAPDLSTSDAGFDAAVSLPDADVLDAALAADGGTAADASSMDAAAGGDAALPDASTLAADSGRDAGGTDGAALRDAAATPDAGTADAGASDAGTADAGAADAGPSDSGAPDAGPSDAGSTDPGTTDPVDPAWTEDCPNMPGVLFCDDFESGFDKWDYSVHIRGSTAVTTDYKRGGTYSLRASTSASTSSQQSQARRSVKALGHRKTGDLWARYFYYLPSSVTLTQKISIGVISEYEDPFFGFSVLVYPDGVGLENGLVSRKTNITTFPRDQWVCVEMHVLVDPSAGKFEVFLNGAQMTSLIAIDTEPDQGYSLFEVGVHYANLNQGPVTAYADDVMLGTRRLGCN